MRGDGRWFRVRGVAAAVVSLLATGAAAPVVFVGTGNPGAQDALNTFLAAIGGANNGSAPPQNNGFRRIDWDDVKLDGTDFDGDTDVIDLYHTVAIPVDRYSARGARLFQVCAVSGDGFATVNPDMAGHIEAFSPKNTMAPFDEHQVAISFVRAGTTERARTLGFGAIFSDVEIAGSSIEYFNDGESLGTFEVFTGASGEVEFLGVVFPTPVVTEVLLTVGTSSLFLFDGITVTSTGPESLPGNVDRAALDDIAFGEPVPEPRQAAVAALGSLLLSTMWRARGEHRGGRQTHDGDVSAV